MADFVTRDSAAKMAFELASIFVNIDPECDSSLYDDNKNTSWPWQCM